MRAVVQRVSRARVTVGGRVVGEIGAGLVVLLGVARQDGDADAAWTSDKLANLRIFSDEHGRMNRSLLETRGEALVVSQFTLYGDARKGRRPSFVRAGEGRPAEELYEQVVQRLRALGVVCETGEFGARMSLELTNEGPVTLLLDSEKTF
ncbi:MAG: D-aminoacyl-tRNA deacylase [Actinomycetota bacterium]|nr:D-aminoacyl-tRNA deacylase [Actinomycetota bacterium]